MFQPNAKGETPFQRIADELIDFLITRTIVTPYERYAVGFVNVAIIK